MRYYPKLDYLQEEILEETVSFLPFFLHWNWSFQFPSQSICLHFFLFLEHYEMAPQPTANYLKCVKSSHCSLSSKKYFFLNISLSFLKSSEVNFLNCRGPQSYRDKITYVRESMRCHGCFLLLAVKNCR